MIYKTLQYSGGSSVAERKTDLKIFENRHMRDWPTGHCLRDEHHIDFKILYVYAYKSVKMSTKMLRSCTDVLRLSGRSRHYTRRYSYINSNYLYLPR